MGLKVHSLGEVPADASRRYYLYLLDYGWEEPLGKALRDNFDNMADAASRHDAAVVLGLGNEFNDNVLSWHGFNGRRDTEDLLPAILITNKHPATFAERRALYSATDQDAMPWNSGQDRLVLLPLQNHCKTPTDVARLINRIFRDIKANRPLADFEIVVEDRAGVGRAILDAVILRPTVGGLGIDLMELLRKFRKGRRSGAQ